MIADHNLVKKSFSPMIADHDLVKKRFGPMIADHASRRKDKQSWMLR